MPPSLCPSLPPFLPPSLCIPPHPSLSQEALFQKLRGWGQPILPPDPLDGGTQTTTTLHHYLYPDTYTNTRPKADTYTFHAQHSGSPSSASPKGRRQTASARMVPHLGHVISHRRPLQQCHKGVQGATPRTRSLAGQYMYTYTYIHAYEYKYTYTCTYVCMLTYTYTNTYPLIHAHTHTCARKHTHTHTITPKQTHTHAHASSRSRTRACTRTCTRTNAHNMHITCT